MNLTITRADNGYYVTWVEYDDEANEIARYEVFEEDDANPKKAMVHLLYRILDYYGELGSKHDAQRIVIDIKEQLQ